MASSAGRRGAGARGHGPGVQRRLRQPRVHARERNERQQERQHDRRSQTSHRSTSCRPVGTKMSSAAGDAIARRCGLRWCGACAPSTGSMRTPRITTPNARAFVMIAPSRRPWRHRLAADARQRSGQDAAGGHLTRPVGHPRRHGFSSSLRGLRRDAPRRLSPCRLFGRRLPHRHARPQLTSWPTSKRAQRANLFLGLGNRAG